MIEKVLFNTVKYGIIIALFTPLILGPFGLTFSAYPKAVFFRTVIEITLVFYLLLVIINPEYAPRLTIISLALISFTAILLIAGFLGINFYRSFFGDPERAEGIILQLHLLAFFFILIGFLRKKEDWINLLKITVIVSGISSIAGLMQKFGIYYFYGVDASSRVSGTLSNPDFFGSYMTLAVFLAVFLVFEDRKWRMLWLAIALVNLLTLFFSGTRGAWIGLITGLLVTFPIFLEYFFRLGRNVKKNILIASAVFLLIISAIIVRPEQFNLDKSFLYQRFYSFSLSSRGEVWNIALKAFWERPLLGWGPESFSYIFDKNFQASSLKYISDNVYFDSSHNRLLDILSSSGLLGILSYLSVLSAVFYYIIKGNYGRSKFVLFAFLVSCIAESFFVFDTICIQILSFVFFAFINGNIPTERRKELPMLLKVSFIPIMVISLVFLYKVNIEPASAALRFPDNAPNERREVKKAIDGYKKSVKEDTIYQKDFRLIYAERLLDLAEYNQNNPNNEKYIVDAIIEIKDDFKKDMEAPDRRMNSYYLDLAKMNERIYLVYKNPDAIKEAQLILGKAIAFNGNRPEFFRLMGELKILESNYNEGESYFQKAYEMGPQSIVYEAKFYRDLGAAYWRTGEKEKAVHNFKKTLEMEYNSQKNTSESIIDKPVEFTEAVAIACCRDLKDFESCKDIYLRAIEIYPEKEQQLYGHMQTLMPKK